MELDKTTQTELEAAAFRRLVEHCASATTAEHRLDEPPASPQLLWRYRAAADERECRSHPDDASRSMVCRTKPGKQSIKSSLADHNGPRITRLTRRQPGAFARHREREPEQGATREPGDGREADVRDHGAGLRVLRESCAFAPQ
jgi:hypothetical protein